MEQRLDDIITRIEASSLSADEKAQLYAAISGGLQGSVWPVLIKLAPPNEIDEILKETDEKRKVERYNALISGVVDTDSSYAEIEETMNKLLDEVDAALKEEHI